MIIEVELHFTRNELGDRRCNVKKVSQKMRAENGGSLAANGRTIRTFLRRSVKGKEEKT